MVAWRAFASRLELTELCGRLCVRVCVCLCLCAHVYRARARALLSAAMLDVAVMLVCCALTVAPSALPGADKL